MSNETLEDQKRQSARGDPAGILEFLLLDYTATNRLAENLGSHLGCCRSASHQWYMVVPSFALPVEFLDETSAARHEARGLLH